MSGLIRVQDTRKVTEAAPSDEIALLGTRPDGSVRRTTRGEINAGAAAAGAAAAIPLAQQEGAAAGQTAAVLAAQPFANAAQIAAELAAMGAMARVGPAVGSLRNVVVDAGYRPIIVGDIHDGLGVRLRGEIVPLTDVAERVQVLEETAGAGSEAGSLLWPLSTTLVVCGRSPDGLALFKPMHTIRIGEDAGSSRRSLRLLCGGWLPHDDGASEGCLALASDVGVIACPI